MCESMVYMVYMYIEIASFSFSPFRSFFEHSYFSECAQIIIGTIMLTGMKIENLFFFF